MPAWCSRSTRQPEVVRVAEARRRREVRRHLVAPGAAERVLHHRHQLDVGEAHLVDIGNELVGQLAVGLALAPGAEVHLVDAHRLGVGVRRRAPLEPVGVVPLVRRLVHDGRVRRGSLGQVRHRVGLLPPDAVATADVELVPRARADARDEQFPDAGRAQRPQRMRAAVPEVEVRGQADALRVRGPDGERRTGDGSGRAVVPADVGAEHGPQLLVPALADQVQVDLAERRAGTGTGRRARARDRRCRSPRGGSRAPCRCRARRPRHPRTHAAARAAGRRTAPRRTGRTGAARGR